MNMLIFIIVFLVFLVFTIGYTYFNIYYICKEDTSNNKYFCYISYILCIIISIGYALYFSKL